MQIELINDDHSCPNCYYEWFDDKAYPCSRCINNKPSEDMFRPKLRAEQTEPQTERNKLINEVVKLDMSREDKFKVIELLERHCEKCKHYLFTDIDGHYCEHETYGQPCGYEPKDEPQIHGIFREGELSDEQFKELKRQVNLFVEYAEKKKDEPQTDCPKSCPTINICTKDDTDCPWK